MRISTALRNHLLVSGSLKAALDGSVVRIYSGVAPSTADDAVPAGAVLLSEVSVDDTGTGITFNGTAADGLVTKSPGEVWQGTNLATGAASWFRIVPPADGGLQSTTALRMQGTVAAAGGDLNLSNVNLTVGAIQTIDYFSVLMPA